MQQCTPRYQGHQEVEDHDGLFLKLTNLLFGFPLEPCVMDVKIGCRTFQEKEAKSDKPRSDLYERLLKLAPDMILPEEKENGSITKYRWMTTNDKLTTTFKECYRICGSVGHGHQVVPKEVLKRVQTAEQAQEAFQSFCEFTARGGPVEEEADEGSDDALSDVEDSRSFALVRGVKQARKKKVFAPALRIAEGLLGQLKRVRGLMEESEFLRGYEMVGASILLTADRTGVTKANLIDFAKTTPMTAKMSTIDHRSPWDMGNHEDGVLLGLDNLISSFEAVVGRLQVGRLQMGNR